MGRQVHHGHSGTGYAYIHSAVDAYSRVAYCEILAAESRATCTAFLARAQRWFADLGVITEAVLTDNGNGYRSRDWAGLCAQLGIEHRRTRAYRPQTNGKVERFNRTLLDEWAHLPIRKRPLRRP